METLFEKLLMKELAELRAIRTQTVTVSGVDSFPDYKFNLGYLQALRDIEQACDAVREEIIK
jgi:hypothetical protein